MSSDQPYTRAEFSGEDGALPRDILRKRLRWAGCIGGSMIVVAVAFLWTGLVDGVPILSGLGILCGVFAALVLVRGVNVFAELRGRQMLDDAV